MADDDLILHDLDGGQLGNIPQLDPSYNQRLDAYLSQPNSTNSYYPTSPSEVLSEGLANFHVNSPESIMIKSSGQKRPAENPPSTGSSIENSPTPKKHTYNYSQNSTETPREEIISSNTPSSFINPALNTSLIETGLPKSKKYNDNTKKSSAISSTRVIHTSDSSSFKDLTSPLTEKRLARISSNKRSPSKKLIQKSPTKNNQSQEKITERIEKKQKKQKFQEASISSPSYYKESPPYEPSKIMASDKVSTTDKLIINSTENAGPQLSMLTAPLIENLQKSHQLDQQIIAAIGDLHSRMKVIEDNTTMLNAKVDQLLIFFNDIAHGVYKQQESPGRPVPSPIKIGRSNTKIPETDTSIKTSAIDKIIQPQEKINRSLLNDPIVLNQLPTKSTADMGHDELLLFLLKNLISGEYPMDMLSTDFGVPKGIMNQIKNMSTGSQKEQKIRNALEAFFRTTSGKRYLEKVKNVETKNIAGVSVVLRFLQEKMPKNYNRFKSIGKRVVILEKLEKYIETIVSDPKELSEIADIIEDRYDEVLRYAKDPKQEKMIYIGARLDSLGLKEEKEDRLDDGRKIKKKQRNENINNLKNDAGHNETEPLMDIEQEGSSEKI